MIAAAFSTVIYDPLYNGLVFLVGILPSHDIGFAVILLTILVRIILYPLARRAVDAQEKMKKIAPQIEALKEKLKDKKEEQGRAIFALYKENDIHPFASFLLVLVQLPILLGLYWVFARGGFPHVDPALLYSFVHAPGAVNMEFLGLVDMGASHSIVLAALAALTQLIYTRLSMGPPQKKAVAAVGSFSGDMAKSFDLQARYMLPVVVGVISYTIAAAAPLYWVTSNTFMIAQEYLAGRRFHAT